MKFVQAFNDIKNFSSPYLRGSFELEQLNGEFELDILVAGLYEVYVNGERLSDDYLTPYRSNAEDIIFLDHYDISKYLVKGKNVISFILGNGFANSLMDVWKFEVGAFNPKIAFEVKHDSKVILDATSLKWHESEIIFNEYHKGEHIDARKLIKDWTSINFDDSSWDKVIECESPKGEVFSRDYQKVKEYETLSPVNVFKGDRGYIYDFGKSVSCIYEIEVKGEEGKTLYVYAGDALEHHTKVFTKSITSWWNNDPRAVGCDWLTLSGNVDVFKPRFSYKGCRFIEIENLTDEEASSLKIKIHVISSLVKRTGDFRCDNEVINKLQELTINSDLSNFIYFPTDCPHREKNGWTGDAAISCEQMNFNFDCAEQFRVWLQTIARAQKENGVVPCICPARADGFGFDWGTGPAWDIVVFELSYRSYIYSGNIEILKEIAPTLKSYIKYMLTRREDNGLFDYGLEDWLTPLSHTPVRVTSTIYCHKICKLAAKIFTILKDEEYVSFLNETADSIKVAYRKVYPYENTANVYTQTWLSLAIEEGFYTVEEAKKSLLHVLSLSNDHIDFGLFGSRHLFRVLSDVGETELAMKLIIQDSYPSYKTCFVDPGMTTLSEYFMPKGIDIFDFDENMINWSSSLNHHMFGDISAFFYRYLAGIRIDDVNVVNFKPCFVNDVNEVEAYHSFEYGNFNVRINKTNEKVIVTLDVPEGITVNLCDIEGYSCNAKEIHKGNNKLEYVKL